MTPAPARVSIATCKILPEPDPDQAPLLEALGAAGAEAERLAWDDAEAPDPARFDLCLLRSTWNYYENPEAFLTWCEQAAQRTALLNGVGAVRWNLHKAYLKQLERAGVRIVPTHLLERGRAGEATALLEQAGWEDVVVKPAISASSFSTRRFRTGEREQAARFLAVLAQERDAMVQRYMASVEAVGERALVWIAGAFTHAIRKQPRFTGEDERVSHALPPADDERAFAERVMEAIPTQLRTDLLYARVDLMRDDDGAIALSELELIEPSLFLAQSPAAMERFVAAILERAQRMRRA